MYALCFVRMYAPDTLALTPQARKRGVTLLGLSELKLMVG